MTHGTVLEEIVKESFLVFKQKSPNNLDVCIAGCCMDPALEKEILATPQADISRKHLDEWFSAAGSAETEMDVLRFLLPRILELLAQGEELAVCGHEVLFRRFGFFSRKGWSQIERTLLDKFRTEFLDTFRFDSNVALLDDAICMFHGGGWSLDDLFDQIYSWPTEDIVNRYWQDWNQGGMAAIRVSYFWDKPERQNLLERYCTPAMELRFIDLAISDETESGMQSRAEIMAAGVAIHVKHSDVPGANR